MSGERRRWSGGGGAAARGEAARRRCDAAAAGLGLGLGAGAWLGLSGLRRRLFEGPARRSPGRLRPKVGSDLYFLIITLRKKQKEY